MNNRTLESVMYYISQGWQVIPLHRIEKGRCSCGKTDCTSPGKHPATPQGTKDATTDKNQVYLWFHKEKWNVGICAGEVSGLVLLDIDPEHGGEEALKKLPPLPKTLTVLTGGGGQHKYYKHPGGDIRNSAGTIGKGLDVRGHHGYLVAPPSNHISGKEYRWAVDPRSMPVADCPAWIIERKEKSASAIEGQKATILEEGQRNNVLTSLAGTMRRRSMDYEAILAALQAENSQKCKPPLLQAEIEQIAHSVSSYEPEKPPSKDTIILKDDLPPTIATAFEKDSPVSHHYNSIDSWSIYSKNQYQQVKDEKEIRLHIRKFLKRCCIQKKKDKKTHFIKLQKYTSGFVKDVLESLAAMPKVHILPSRKAPCCFDNALDPATTVALKNGLLDVSNMNKPVVKPFTPNFYTFNYLPVAYNPKAEAPVWIDKLLSYYFTEEDPKVPDKIAQNVLHSWMKRWLLRIVDPHKICAIIGEPRSGKSTIGRITSNLIGGTNVSSITITSLAGNHGLHGLMTKQLGIMWDASISGRAGDVNKAVEVLKTISGQDNITINPKHRDTIDLTSMKLNILMLANKPANLRDDTGALASRLTFLKTTQSFMGHEDPTIEAHVIAAELPGILNLILKAPNTILEHPNSATMSQEFLETSSPYTAFVNDCCITGNPDLFIPTNILWAYYYQWCKKFNHKPPSAQAFKMDVLYAIRGIIRYRPTLTEEQISELEAEHRLDTRPGLPLKIKKRDRCFRCIDLQETAKGEWFDPRSGQPSSDGPSYEEGKPF